MILVFATTNIQTRLAQLINQREGLQQLLTIQSTPDASTQIVVDEEGLHLPLDWWDTRPPILIEDPIPLSLSNLLGLCCLLTRDYEQAYGHFQSIPSIQRNIGFMYQLSEGMAIDLQDWHISSTSSYKQLHNLSILKHYGHLSAPASFQELAHSFKEALSVAPDIEHSAFTLKYYLTLLIDTQQFEEAETILRTFIDPSLSESGKIALDSLLIAILKEKLTPPYQQKVLQEVKDLIWRTKNYFESHSYPVQTALAWIDASFVANLTESYAEALGYVNTAINILKEEEIPLILGDAFLRKATLLQSWAGNGNPQFYSKAIESYQEALKIFNRETHPYTFADIHHKLALVYIEMPAPPPKKAMLASISVSSFEEALQFFTQQQYPYEFGMICNNYGNAYTKYPTAYGIDNYHKAIHLLKAALSVRPAETFPVERTITILNLLEAYWNYPDEKNVGDFYNKERYEEMVSLSEEATRIAPPGTELEASVNDHIARLNILAKSIYA